MIAREAMGEAALLLLAVWYGRKKFSTREAARGDFKNDWKNPVSVLRPTLICT